MNHYLAFAGAVMSLTASIMTVVLLLVVLVSDHAGRDWWAVALGAAGLPGWLLMAHSCARIWFRHFIREAAMMLRREL